MKKFLYYFLSTLLLGFTFYWMIRYQHHLEEQSQMNFNVLPLMIYATCINIVFGLLLRLPKFMIDIRDHKPWTFQWIKLTAIGLPALYIATMPILYYTASKTVYALLPFKDQILPVSPSSFTVVAGVVAGYVILDSLKGS